ncbi:MAG: response regulator [Thermoguttaceae bacterium]
MVHVASILLADSDVSFRESTAELLRGDGFRCDVASDGGQAAELLKAGSYDVVIAGIRMSGNQRLELVEQIAGWSPGLPVIVVTGCPSMETAVSSVHLQVAAYLTKPLGYGELRCHLERLLVDSQWFHTVARVRGQLRQCVRELGRLERSGRVRGADGDSTALHVPQLTLKSLAGCISELVTLEAGAAGPATVYRTCQLVECPSLSHQRDVLRQAVGLLEETKRRFKSKELAQIRQMLEPLLTE